MLSLILGFITGLAGPLSTIASKIIDLQEAKLNASSTEEKAKIDQEISESHDRKAEIIAQAGDRLASLFTEIVRVLITIPVVAIFAKLLLWDKVVGSFEGCAGATIYPNPDQFCYMFTTDPLDTNLWLAIAAVLAFFFSYDMYARKS